MAWRWAALLLMCASVAAVGAFALTRWTYPASAQHGPSGPPGPSLSPTLANPLPGATPVAISDASNALSALGGPLVLPDAPQATAADVGTAWMNQALDGQKHELAVAVAVTFPQQGLIITYTRPTVADPQTYIQQAVKSEPGSKLISLGSVSAWAIPEPSDGSNWGIIQFIVGGALIQVDGHTDLASLQAIAQSIVDRASASG